MVRVNVTVNVYHEKDDFHLKYWLQRTLQFISQELTGCRTFIELVDATVEADFTITEQLSMKMKISGCTVNSFGKLESPHFQIFLEYFKKFVRTTAGKVKKLKNMSRLQHETQFQKVLNALFKLYQEKVEVNASAFTTIDLLLKINEHGTSVCDGLKPSDNIGLCMDIFNDKADVHYTDIISEVNKLETPIKELFLYENVRMLLGEYRYFGWVRINLTRKVTIMLEDTGEREVEEFQKDARIKCGPVYESPMSMLR